MRKAAAVFTTVVALAVPGCGEDNPAERLEDAQDRAREAGQEYQDAEQKTDRLACRAGYLKLRKKADPDAEAFYDECLARSQP